MSNEVDSRVARLEATTDALTLRIARNEDAERRSAAESPDFYRTTWPPVQATIQLLPGLREEVTGIRDEMRELRTLIQQQNTASTLLPTRIDQLTERTRELKSDIEGLGARVSKKQDEIDKEISSLKRFTWILTGGGFVAWSLAQIALRLSK